MMMYTFGFLCFVILLGIISAGMCPLKFKDCGSVEGKISNVTYNGTCKGGIAELKRGTQVLIDFKFSPQTDQSKLTSIVHGKLGPAFIPFPLDNPDACKDSGLKCPIKAGQTYEYTPVLDVKSFYPRVRVVVKWELQDANKKDVFCTMVGAVIV